MFSLHNPHAFLGIHPVDKGNVIRLWRPDADDVYLEVEGEIVSAHKTAEKGLFELHVPHKVNYKVYHTNGLLAPDPYTFSPTLGEVDAYLFGKGVHYKLYEVLGARLTHHLGCLGVKFAVWAPSALSVSVVGDFNGWDTRVNPLRSFGSSGIWEIFIPGLEEGSRYKFAIQTKEGITQLKIDPLAYGSELRPYNASIVRSVDSYQWQDQKWMQKRLEGSFNQPINVYELHLGSWKRGENGFLNYRELAHEIASYVQKMGFTHIELMPVAEHPLDESWGYQVSGFYAVTSRYGTPSDFQYFVDHMHANGIGVILDWVAAHFPMDNFSLAHFDGTSLYEHSDPRQGYHPHWNTYIFNYGRFEVSNFLLANALFWLDKMHIDGLRVDAVASMIYLDYGRREGEWIPNRYGGKENLEAIEFLKHLNAIIQEKFPKVLTIAEESTAFPRITHPLAFEGLGFTMKWNMGWMNDTLKYFKIDPFFRHYDHHLLTFGFFYCFSERFMLVLSHDEVVHCKASLLSKMPGDDWQKFANLRLLYSYMMCHSGKKLLFMGGELADRAEWNCKTSLNWSLQDSPLHGGMQMMVRDLNFFYRENPALWEKDGEDSGFAWIDCSDRENSVISYLRKGKYAQLFCVHNFTPNYFQEYRIPLKNVSFLKEVFSSDRQEYGGSNKLNNAPSIRKDLEGRGLDVTISLAPLATMIFAVTWEN